MSGFKVEPFFYAVLGICGVLLALQALMSAFRIVRAERAAKERDSVSPVKNAVEISSDLSGSRSPRYWFPYAQSMTGRTMVFFALIVGAFGLVTIALVYFKLTGSLYRQAVERAKVMAVNVGDNAVGYMVKKNNSGLRDLLRKQADRPEVAYILVQNNANKIFAHSLTAFPPELQTLSPTVKGERLLQIGSARVLEVSAPVSEGHMGMVRLGLWRDKVDAEISQTVRPLVEILFAVLGAGLLMAMFLAWRINRPIVRLVRAAQKISSGDLETPPFGTSDNTEFGELARALERMRSSIKAAMARLSEERHL